jgi:4-hydroxybenzoate polyprenyltransferase
MQFSKSFIQIIFFGNFFYGVCAVALSIESSVQQSYPLNTLLYYIFLFASTTIYYNKAYIAETTANSTNKRSLWYLVHRKNILRTQAILTFIVIVTLFFLAKEIWLNLIHMPLAQWLLVLIFPFIAAMYYGMLSPKYNFRNTGWIKPFVIGFVWAGVVNIYPVLFRDIKYDQPYSINFFGIILFIKNFMYITVLCIMFDIKDYANDHNQQLKTFVVRVGLRKTIFYIMIPLCILGFGTFLVFTISRHFPLLWIMMNAIPFILLIIVAYSMHRRKRILYYLAIIDGLMLVKAICGITGMILIK